MLQFLRMAKWIRHPPSAGRVKLVFGIVALCLALAAVERWIGWPDALSPEPTRRSQTLR